MRRYIPEFSCDTQTLRPLISYMEDQRFSGSEVEAGIIDSVQISFPNLPTAHQLEMSIKKIVPAAITSSEDVKRIEEWAKQGRARMAA